MPDCGCYYGDMHPHEWMMSISIEDVRRVVSGQVAGARIEDPRNERIVVMGSYIHMEATGRIYRLDHWDAERELIHCVWPD